jgi:hypothetical protein
MPRLGAFVDTPLETEQEPADHEDDAATPAAAVGPGPASSDAGRPGPPSANGTGPDGGTQNGPNGPNGQYVGRRRSESDYSPGDSSGGGRRRRTENEDDDVLGRLLGR